VFGKNEIVGQKYFNDAGDKLFVTSIFYTLQGEGPYRGEPAVFVRLAKCNLACSFCDTYFDGGDWLTFQEIDRRIDRVVSDYFNGDVPVWARELWGGVAEEGDASDQQVPLKPREMVLVITGGEPMLQKNLGPFLRYMETRFRDTQIESNGTLLQEVPASTTLVVSPKCSEKGGKPVKYLQPNQEVIDRADCLKFVMSADQSSPYGSIPDWAHDYASNGKNVFISPMNIYNKEPQKSKQLRSNKNDISLEERSQVDEVISFWEEGLLNMKENQKNHEYAAQYCARHGFTFNMQLHLFASLA
jgi:7-carboxy-7-deazaguanine synthase